MPLFCTHVKESFLADVFGSANGRGGDHNGLHLSQVDVSSTVGVFAGVVIPQLRGEAEVKAAVRRRI